MADEPKKKRMHAKYQITYFDALWNPLDEFPKQTYTASDMVEAVERWNRLCQAEARNNPMTIPNVQLAEAMTIEVIYVEA